MIDISQEIKELRGEEQRLLNAIAKLRKEALAALQEDMPKFPEREVKRRFLAAKDFARELPREKIAEIKKTLRERAAPLANEVLAEMEDETRWLAGLEHLDSAGKSLADNPKLWEPTARLAEFVRTVLEAYGFPNANDPPVEYKMPPYFIKGKYLPSLAEKYWGLLRELADVRARLEDLQEYKTKEELARKWEEA